MNTVREGAVGVQIESAYGDAACQSLVGSDKSGRCTNFERFLRDCDAFKDAARRDRLHWFKDLLSLWCPSGYCSGDVGLRLAIRPGYLNFYRLGQSIALVESLSGNLVAHVHCKYVLNDPPSVMTKSPYLRLTSKGAFFRNELVAPYEGPPTLHKWIVNAKNHTHDEKTIVDELVAKNDHVVDLEMAIPAWARSKSAVRMDLVAIENGTVVFWEAKTITNSEIRCRAEFEQDKSPKVLRQLANYEIYLKQGSHLDLVERAYRKTAELLVKLRALADGIGPTLALGPSIVAASKANRLDVATEAALVVVDLPADKMRAWKSWKACHESKLLGKIPMRVLESPSALVFAGAK